MQDRIRMGIVGHGFVGQAVDFAFTHPEIQKFYVDPKHNTTIDDLIEWQPNVTFICAPTPIAESGFVDASIVEDAVLKVLEHCVGLVVVKSTVTPDIALRLYNSLYDDDVNRLIFNPETLTEASAKRDFIESEFQIIGGNPEAGQHLAQFYGIFSQCDTEKFVFCSGPEACMAKYAINTFLAMKVTFFNQLFDACKEEKLNWPTMRNAVLADKRIGKSHTVVPGFDGKRGFGGACFPKDTLAFTKFSDKLTLLEKCVNINNEYRKQYDLDEREKVNNVDYGQTQEELKNQDDGSSV